MSTQVMALKWRPQVFADLVGQEHVTRTLMNAVSGAHLAHAYIFAGPRGVGKTTTARIFAKVLNCRSPKDAEPCNECDNCREVAQGTSLDVIEIDAASVNGIEGIRSLQEQVGTFPSKGKYKVYIFDEAHRISKPAFDAFLKTLEEPPAHVIFILASTEIHSIPPTIQSRCQRFEFRSMGMETLLAQLGRIAKAEGIEADPQAMHLVARSAGGSMRDAQRTLDQVVAFCGRKVTLNDVRQVLGVVETEILLEAVEASLRQDAPAALSIVRKVADGGKDLEQFYRGLLEMFRHLAVARAYPDAANELIPLAPEEVARIKEASGNADDAFLLSALRLLLEQEHTLRHSAFPQVVLETVVLELSRLRSLVVVEEALAGIPLPTAAFDAPPSRGPVVNARVAYVAEETPPLPVTKAPEVPAKAEVRDVPEAGEPVLAVEEIVEAGAGANEAPEFAKVKSMWRDVLDRVYALNRALQGVLADTKPQSYDNGTLLLACKSSFHREHVEKPENRKLVETIISEVTGVQVHLAPILAGAKTPPVVKKESLPDEVQKPMGKTTPEVAEAMKDPWVESVVKTFNGKVVDVKKTTRPNSGS